MKKEKKGHNIGKIFNIVLTVLGIGSFSYFAYRILEANIIPIKYFVGLTISTGLIILIFILLMYKPKKIILNNIFRVLTLIASIGFIFVSTYFSTFTDFVNKIVDTSDKIQYNFVVRIADSDNIYDYKDKKIGFINMDEEYSLEFLKKIKFSDYNVEIDTLDEIANKLLKKQIDAMILNDTLIEALKHEDSNFNFESQFKIITKYTLNIKEKSSSSKTVNVSKESFIVYISGLDTYGQISNRSRSDVNILAIVNPKTNKILLVHIPRDAYMKLSGTTGKLKDKLTHSGVYGINNSVQTIENYFGININYYIKINFTTLVNSVDLLGGITVNNESAFTSNGIKFPAGYINLNGNEALWYSRERKSLSGGDVSRGQHQQDVIVGIIDKVTKPSIITKYHSFLKSLNNSFDTNMSSSDISKLVQFQLDKMPKWSTESYSLSGKGLSEYTYTYPRRKLYVMELDPTQVETAKNLISAYME